MSRSTVAKSRAEKGGKSSAAATPAVTHEIIPGKFNDQDWNGLLDHDEGDDFIVDVVEEAVGSALDVIFSNYIQKQLVPYTVQQARDAIVQIIEWQFLSRDEGEKNIEGCEGWLEDEEPQPAVTDCWAQGSVPKTVAPSKLQERDTEQDEYVRELETVREEDTEEPEAVEETQEQEEDTKGEEEECASSIPMEESVREDTMVKPHPPESPRENKDTQKKRKYRPHKGKLKSAGVSKMTQSLEDTEFEMMWQEHISSIVTKTPDPESLKMPLSCQSLIKLQAGRPPGNHDVMFDDQGNIIGVPKIDPSHLPSHRVKTKFQVIDPAVEAAQARLDAMRTGRYVKAAPPPQYKDKEIRSSASGKSIRTYTVRSQTSQAFGGPTLEGMAGLPPPLIEAMEVSPGVIVREGDRVKAGPRQQPRKTDLIAMATKRGLRPIHMKPNIPTISLSDLLEHQTPLVKPITENRPVPPITTTPIGTQ